MLTSKEIYGAVMAALAAGLILGATFGGAKVLHHVMREKRTGRPPDASTIALGRSYFGQSCAHCHGADADGGEDAPGIRRLQISDNHIKLLLQAGIKDEMPSFAKRYDARQTDTIIAYLRTLR